MGKQWSNKYLIIIGQHTLTPHLTFKLRNHSFKCPYSAGREHQKEDVNRGLSQAVGKLQSHPNTMRGYRRLSLTAFACLLAG